MPLPVPWNIKQLDRETLVGTAGFEFNGPHAGPLFHWHLSKLYDRICSYRQLWTGKHSGKHFD